MRFAWVCLAVALAACQTGAGGNELGLCSAVCRCAVSQLPAEQRACLDQCVRDADTSRVTDACEECVFENSQSCTHMMERCFASGGACRPQPEPFPGAADTGLARSPGGSVE